MSREITRKYFGEFLAVFSKELRETLRDRRAATVTFVLPLLMYPALFFLTERLTDMRASDTVEQAVRLGLHGDYGTFYRSLEESDSADVVLDVPLSEKLLESGEFDVIVGFEQRQAAEPGMSVTVLFDGALALSREGRRRVDKLIERFRLRLVADRFAKVGVEVDPESMVSVITTDGAAERDIAEAFIARILASVLVLLLFTGGAFAAMDLVAGEKERGTLETLMVHPVSAQVVAAAKFAVVIVCSLASVLLNVTGILVGQKLLPSDGMMAGLSTTSWQMIGLVLLPLIPLSLFTSGLLLAISSRSKTFREAQTYMIPVMLGSLMLSLLAAIPDVTLNPITAWVPISNVALAIRDTITGDIENVSLFLVLASTSLYATFAVRWSAELLKREETLLGTESQLTTIESGVRTRSRRAISFSILMLLSVFYAGTVIQSPQGWFGPQLGLALTLWGFVLIPALVYPRLQRIPLAQALALRAPAPRDVVLCLLLVPAAAVLVLAYSELQDHLLPFPTSVRESFEALGLDSVHPFLAFLLYALSPAICEEVLWRGTVQGELEYEGRPWKTILTVGIFFGLFHFSVYRFVPTALVGILLAALRWRTQSIVPSVLFHGAYNSLLIFGLAPLLADGGAVAEVISHPATVTAACGILFLALRKIGKPMGT